MKFWGISELVDRMDQIAFDIREAERFMHAPGDRREELEELQKDILYQCEEMVGVARGLLE